MSDYRGDLEAAQQRASDLQHEADELRERNQRLEAQIAARDTSEATTNARRLAAAIAREQEEQRVREQTELDERAARERAKAERRWQFQERPVDRPLAAVLVTTVGVLIILAAHMNYAAARGVAIVFGAIAALVGAVVRAISSKGNR